MRADRGDQYFPKGTAVARPLHHFSLECFDRASDRLRQCTFSPLFASALKNNKLRHGLLFAL